ncbi:MAG: formylglycine-generating enzyme family protein [Kiritimatiellae bacterium]|nr:formylglycine-generating enzyme family protein [Kiritimatiellia bacterium]
MKRIVLTGLGMMMMGWALFVSAADEEVREVAVRQRWPWSPKVDIHYVVACDPTQRVDVAVEGFNNGASLGRLPEASLSGDVYGVSYGEHHIVWDPAQTAYSNTPLTGFSVALSLVPAKTYMIIDLSKSAGQEGQITYRTDGVWYDITNRVEHMTTNLVLRRIEPDTYIMGAPGAEIKDGMPQTQHAVTLTQPFYIGVFEFTQAQCKQIMPSYTGGFTVDGATRPAEKISYNTLRGTVAGASWPTNHDVDATSFIGLLRTKTGLKGLDLPTEAQWEYACRAGTGTGLNNGTDITNSLADGNLALLGRYKYNGGCLSSNRLDTGAVVYYEPPVTVGVTGGTARVGSYLPNAWGLYDMHGNVTEWCLDFYTNNLGAAAVIDPRGPAIWEPFLALKYLRMRRGGAYLSTAVQCRSAYRCDASASYMQAHDAPLYTGFRVVVPLPLEQ